MPTEEPPRPITLPYASPRGESDSASAAFRLGLISVCTASIVLVGVVAAAILVSRDTLSSGGHNAVLRVFFLMDVLGFGCGIGGLFQRRGRDLATIGITICFLEAMMLPAIEVG